MAVQPQTPYKEYTANGSAKSFALEFDCDNQDHLIVLVDGIEPVVGTWSLIGGAVVFGTAPINGKKITIQRNTPFRRDGDFQSYDNSFRPGPVNKGFDWVWLKLQELGVADWILSNRIDALKAYVDDRDDELRAYLLEEIRKQGVALEQLDDYYNYLMQRLAQIAVDKGWDASFVVDGDKTQKQINDATIQKVKTLADLIAKSPRGDGQVINVESYFTPNYALADPYMGGDKFVWQANVSKSLHDGGYVIDPLIPIPSLATFNTYHTAQNSTNGIWVRLSGSSDILAENYGMSQSASAVWNCSSVQKALFKGASTNPHKRVMLPAGAYRTTNPIVLSKYAGSAQSGNTYRVPALIGKGRFATEFAKVTKNTVGAGYQCGDIDAIVVCSPKTGEDQIFGEETGGFGLMRYSAEALDSGYGYFSMNAPYGNRYDMRMNRAGVYGYWQDNCWMSTVKQINAISCKNGVAIRGGTSVNGTNIYADTCSQIGIDLYGLTYSNLTVHADRCGGDTASANGYPAIRANLTKGATVTASIEHHRGADFEIKQSDGLVVNAGRGIGVGAVPITSATSKVILEDCAVVFNGFSWRYALDGLTASEAGLYSFLTKTGNSVTYEFNGCQGNAAWNDFPLQVSDAQYYGKKTYSGYSENNRIVTSRVSHNSGSFKRWFYAGDASARVRVLSAMAEGSDQYYDFTALIVIGGISKNSGAPTTLTAPRYASGSVATGIDIQAYLNTADGWVYIKPSAGGANLVFNYVLIK